MCVYETGLLLLFAYIALLLLPLSFVLGLGAPSLSLVGFIFVIEAVRRGSLRHSHGSLLHQLFLLCFGLIGANSNSMNSISRAASSGR